VILRWSSSARQDLREIGQYIARDNPKAARGWVEKLRIRAQQAASIPRSGRIVPEFGRDDIREVLEGSYRIVYQISSNAVEVLVVMEGHRLLRPMK
jgi:plasmid stabilization system protein ParE